MEFPFDITNLLGGPTRLLWAPASQAVPASPKDVALQISPYTKATGWNEFGATRDPSTYDRAFAAQNWQIQQSSGVVVRKPTISTRRVSVSIAEINEKTMQIIEQTASTGTVASATGLGAQKEVGMGDIDSFTRYRIAFQSMRDDSAGLVNEPVGATPPSGVRGRFIMGVAWLASITADTAALEQARETQSAVNVIFEFFPDTTQVQAKRYGVWWLEDAGTIT